MANVFKAKKILSTSGVFSTVVLAPNLVYNTGDQAVSGVKNFSDRPTVNGTGVLLSGEAGGTVDLSNYATTGQLTQASGTLQSQIDNLSVNNSIVYAVALG